MKKIRITLAIFLMVLLTACSNLRDDILSIIQQETSNNTNQTTNDNWEENINCRYKAALINNNMELLKECLEDGADINDVNGLSPVFLAYTRKNNEMAEYLLDLGSSPNWSHNDGYTILHYLSDSTNYEECKMLLEYGADVNFIDGEGMSEIDYAATKIVKKQLTTNCLSATDIELSKDEKTVSWVWSYKNTYSIEETVEAYVGKDVTYDEMLKNTMDELMSRGLVSGQGGK